MDYYKGGYMDQNAFKEKWPLIYSSLEMLPETKHFKHVSNIRGNNFHEWFVKHCYEERIDLNAVEKELSALTTEEINELVLSGLTDNDILDSFYNNHCSPLEEIVQLQTKYTAD